jgi:uncharacterized protein (DUF427 family)
MLLAWCSNIMNVPTNFVSVPVTGNLRIVTIRNRVVPLPGKESVWDYPRPPRIEPATRNVRIEFEGVTIVSSPNAVRVLETAGAPTYYIPSKDIRMEHLRPSPGGGTWCEWKGAATYFDVVVGEAVAERAAWTYPDPTPRFKQLLDHYSFYPGRVGACYLDDELVTPQPGGFYGGWVTRDIVGPIKGEPGTEGW